MKQFASALKYITEIIERGIKEHPGMWVWSNKCGRVKQYFPPIENVLYMYMYSVSHFHAISFINF